MDDDITLLLSRAAVLAAQCPVDWPAPATVMDYHAAINDAVSGVAEMMDTYQSLHRVMSSVSTELTVLRTGYDYMLSIPGFVHTRRSLGIVHDVEVNHRGRVTLSEEVLRNSNLMIATCRGYPRAVESSSELISMGHEILSSLFQRLAFSDHTLPATGLSWPGRYDGLLSLDDALARLTHTCVAITDYQGHDAEIDAETLCAAGLRASWNYLTNCPAFTERCTVAHARNAGEWQHIGPGEFSPDMFPYLDIYLAKALLGQARLQFRLMILRRYVDLGMRFTADLHRILAAADAYYAPQHPHRQQYLEVRNYVYGVKNG